MATSSAPSVLVTPLLFGRFEVLEELGSGGFGRVLRCVDRESGNEVAVKELIGMRPAALLALKHEFRMVAEVQHEGLVRLYELFEEAGHWGFSMELVPGSDFLAWTRSERQGLAFDERRLRAGLVALLEALGALHRAGLVHRDVKPDNVRVTPEGKVKLLDFGLVQAGHDVLPQEGLGTVAFMAPEQARGERVGEAADHYALGVLLYEVLTGELPFNGTAIEIMFRKQKDLPEPPSARSEGVPADLEAICMGLLAPTVEARLSGHAVLERLTGEQGGPLHSFKPSVLEPFVGRRRERELLHAALDRARAGTAQVVLIAGESGIGKSALVSTFMAEVRDALPNAWCMFGRCQPVEHVPFKMFDGVVDGLSGQLRSLPTRELHDLLPARPGLLSRLFHVLDRVPAVQRDHAALESVRAERFELFATFAELLARISRREPLVLAVDDLQWADADSFALLDVVLDLARHGNILMVATVRSLDALDAGVGPSIKALTARSCVQRLALPPLDDAEAQRLVQSLTSLSRDDGMVANVCRAGAGHPMFVTELAKQLSLLPAGIDSALELDALLRKRVHALGDGALDVLTLLALSGSPLPRSVLAHAARAKGEDFSSVLLLLRRERLARFVRAGELACYHDRVREAMLADLSKEQTRAGHLALAQAWAAAQAPDAGAIARHFMAAGSLIEAAPWLVRAAERAMASAAFEQATKYFAARLELDAAKLSEPERRVLTLSYARALAASGRSRDAAHALLAALPGAVAQERVQILAGAAQQLLQAAEVEEGVEAARRAMEEADLAWPQSPSRAIFRLLWYRTRLALHPAPKLLQADADLDARARAQLEILFHLAQPLSWADLTRAVELWSRHLWLSHLLGSARHVELGLRSEAVVRAMQDAKGKGSDALFARADLIKGQASPDLVAFRAFARGQSALVRWKLRDAESALLEAETLYRETCPEEHWQHTNVRSLLLSTWFTLGRFGRLMHNADVWLRDAEQRGDKFALASLGVVGFGFMRHIMRGDLDAAAEEIERAMKPWRGPRVGIQHLGEAFAQHVVLAGRGGDAALRYWDGVYPTLRRSFLMRAAFSREAVLVDRFWAAVSAAANASEAASRASALVRAEQYRREIGKPRTPWSHAALLHLDGELSILQARPERALQQLKAASAGYDEIGHFAGRLLGDTIARLGGSDRDERSFSDELTSEGFRDPALWIRIWSPSSVCWTTRTM